MDGSVAYAPISKSAPKPARPPVGYVEINYPDVGRMYVPASYAPGGVLSAGYEAYFGDPATGYPAPVVSLAPPPPISVTVTNTTYGTRTLSVPPAPDGFTIISFLDNVAYVPTSKESSKPAKPPAGYVEISDPDVGRMYVPASYASGGVLGAGYEAYFGGPAT